MGARGAPHWGAQRKRRRKRQAKIQKQEDKRSKKTRTHLVRSPTGWVRLIPPWEGPDEFAQMQSPDPKL